MQMSDEEIRYSDRWINDHYLFMVHPEQTPTLGWFLDMAETAVVRRGARIIQLDPWKRGAADASDRRRRGFDLPAWIVCASQDR
jgi:hypothetical protein